MKFIPQNKKFNKIFKLRLKKKIFDYKTIKLNYGNYGIKALSNGLLTIKHYNSLQLIIKRGLKKKGNFIFRKFPFTFTTKKPLEVRMGKGKGSHHEWVCPIKIGQILLEFNLEKLSIIEKINLLKKCCNRLPVKTTIITKTNKNISLKWYLFKHF